MGIDGKAFQKKFLRTCETFEQEVLQAIAIACSRIAFHEGPSTSWSTTSVESHATHPQTWGQESDCGGQSASQVTHTGKHPGAKCSPFQNRKVFFSVRGVLCVSLRPVLRCFGAVLNSRSTSLQVLDLFVDAGDFLKQQTSCLGGSTVALAE